MDIGETNIGNLTDGLAMDTVVLEGPMEMEDAGDCRRSHGANAMDVHDSQTSRQVHLERGPRNTPASHKKKQKRGSHQGGNDEKNQLARFEKRYT